MSLGPILYLVAKYQMSSGPPGPIFQQKHWNKKEDLLNPYFFWVQFDPNGVY